MGSIGDITIGDITSETIKPLKSHFVLSHLEHRGMDI